MLLSLVKTATDERGDRYLVLSLAQAKLQETRAFTCEHARFLASLGKARFRVADFEHAAGCRWLQSSIRDLQHKKLDEKCVQALQHAYRDCEAALLYWTGPYVLSQGDFAPWNIRTFGSQLFVFDWGQARAEASPLDDVLHYLMVQRALRHRPVGVRFLRAPGLSRMDLAAARHRRADPRLPSRRGCAPRARERLVREQRLLAVARSARRLDARLIFGKEEKP